MMPIQLKLASAIAVASTLADNVPLAIPVLEQKVNAHGRKGVRIRDTKRRMTKRKRKEKRKHQQQARR